jgi:hypothetical protein
MEVDLTLEQNLRIFVGDNEEYYERKWNKEYSWNWVAFFFTFFWLGYRKMFKQIIILISLFTLLDVIIYFLDTEDATATSLIFGFIFSLIYGFIGNSLYKKKAEKTIINIKRINYSEDNEEKEIAKKGGTSIAGIFGAIGLIILYFIISSLIYGLLNAILYY